jgi:co-chaperonin GroES (HSP10)
MNSEEIEDSIAGLLAASQQQEKTAKGSVAALAVAVGELKTTSESLKTGVERAISENMGKCR